MYYAIKYYLSSTIVFYLHFSDSAGSLRTFHNLTQPLLDLLTESTPPLILLNLLIALSAVIPFSFLIRYAASIIPVLPLPAEQCTHNWHRIVYLLTNVINHIV